MNHLDPQRLLDATLGPPDGNRATARHLAGCARCREEVARLRASALDVALESQDEPAPGCLDPMALSALVEGTLPEPGRASALTHLVGCGACRAELAGLATLLEAPAIRRALETGRSGGALRPLLRIGLPLAAAAVLLLLVGRPLGLRDGDNHRASVITQAATPTLIAPVGSVAGVRELAWQPIPGADRYRVTVFDASGSVVFEHEGRDSLFTVPDSIVFVEGGVYLWRVEARVGWDRWVGTPLARFDLVSPAP